MSLHRCPSCGRNLDYDPKLDFGANPGAFCLVCHRGETTSIDELLAQGKDDDEIEDAIQREGGDITDLWNYY